MGDDLLGQCSFYCFTVQRNRYERFNRTNNNVSSDTMTSADATSSHSYTAGMSEEEQLQAALTESLMAAAQGGSLLLTFTLACPKHRSGLVYLRTSTCILFGWSLSYFFSCNAICERSDAGRRTRAASLLRISRPLRISVEQRLSSNSGPLPRPVAHRHCI